MAKSHPAKHSSSSKLILLMTQSQPYRILRLQIHCSLP
ncbi:hypothetical protein CCACVL1_26238 [Corchorus capsularis]|uniref:Uncharacterized protein n=1 Tax=Corchorus capsularis TaxID=210143 RepID=A0A1R3GFF9_COCAP|nr:hypothetical protein CCACVL1_26238 [Corchorus capsularis]